MKYKLILDNIDEFGMGGPYAGVCYAIGADGKKYFVHNMVMQNPEEIADNVFAIKILKSKATTTNGQYVLERSVQLGILNATNKQLSILNKAYPNILKIGVLKNETLAIIYNDWYGKEHHETININEAPIAYRQKMVSKFYFKKNQAKYEVHTDSTLENHWQYFETDLIGNILRQIIEKENNEIVCNWVINNENGIEKPNQATLQINDPNLYNIYNEDFFSIWNTYADLNNLKNLIPIDKFDYDKLNGLTDLSYFELQPIIPSLLTWLQDINWPVAQYLVKHLVLLLPNIIDDLKKILIGQDAVWKYHILNTFFIKNQISYHVRIIDVINQLAFNPSVEDLKEEVHILAQEILKKPITKIV